MTRLRIQQKQWRSCADVGLCSVRELVLPVPNCSRAGERNPSQPATFLLEDIFTVLLHHL